MEHERLSRVLSGALRVWRVEGSVSRDPQDPHAWLIDCEGVRVALHHDPLSGWAIALGDSVERHAGLPGVLRALRAELAPEAPAGRLIIASLIAPS